MPAPKKPAPKKASGIQEITFVLTEGKDYRLIPISGVVGGVTPDGMIWADLFLEHGSLPETMSHAVVDGKLGQVTGRTGLDSSHPSMERRREVGVVMTVRTAQALIGWLKNKIKTAGEVRKEAGNTE